MANESMLIGGLQEPDDKRVSVKDILNFIFDKENIEQKTILSAKNIDALIKMKATNKHLKRIYGFDIRLYDIIIDEKRLNIISRDGKGRNDILDAVRAMQNPVIQKKKKGIL